MKSRFVGQAPRLPSFGVHRSATGAVALQFTT